MTNGKVGHLHEAAALLLPSGSFSGFTREHWRPGRRPVLTARVLRKYLIPSLCSYVSCPPQSRTRDYLLDSKHVYAELSPPLAIRQDFKTYAFDPLCSTIL